jgi:hypothetical protein
MPKGMALLIKTALRLNETVVPYAKAMAAIVTAARLRISPALYEPASLAHPLEVANTPPSPKMDVSSYPFVAAGSQVKSYVSGLT